MTFDGSEKLIGTGAQAKVYLYHGFAWKVYNESYPAEWIAFEKEQQQAVNKAGLCPVKYYDTDDSHIIKMDLVEGDQLEKSVPATPEQGFLLLARAFRLVHEADPSDTTIPPLSATAGLMLTDEEKSQVLPIIDWMNARLAPPIFDYARTYVIFDEFAKEALEFYKTAVWPDVEALGISENDFFDAVKVCTVLRSKEK